MLDGKDLQAIAQLMEEKIGSSEKRMMQHTEKAISDSEARMAERMETRAEQSESHMLSMMEAYFEPRFNLLGEQIQLIQEKLTPAGDLEALEDRADVVEVVVKQHSREIETLKKAL